MTVSNPGFCTTCGAARVPGDVFCTGCGATLAPAASDPFAGSLTTVGHGRTGRRTPLVALLVVMILVLGAGGAAAFVLMGDDPGPTGAQAEVSDAPTLSSTTSSPSSAGASTASASSTEGSALPGGRPSATAAVEAVCWDGSRTATLRRCTSPTGLAGLAWLFTGVDIAGCERLNVTYDRTTYSCADGDVTLNFSEWRRFETAERYYTKKLAELPAPAAVPGLLRWTGVAPRTGLSNGALVYRDLKWSASVYASSTAELDQALRELRPRPADEYAGTVSP